jgi:CheY-like chemotaxis protein
MTAGRNDVLIVDDELAIQDYAEMTLSRLNVPYRLAFSGQQALQKADEGWPAVVLLDVGLRLSISCWDTWAGLQTLARGRPLRVLLFTAGDLTPTEEAQLRARGGLGVVPKPPDTRQLVQLLRHCVAEARDG